MSVEGVGYEPEGRISGLSSYITSGSGTGNSEVNAHMGASNLRDLAAISSLCNEASIEYKEGDKNAEKGGGTSHYARMGEPTEAALKVLVEKLGVQGIDRTSDPAGKAHQHE